MERAPKKKEKGQRGEQGRVGQCVEGAEGVFCLPWLPTIGTPARRDCGRVAAQGRGWEGGQARLTQACWGLPAKFKPRTRPHNNARMLAPCPGSTGSTSRVLRTVLGVAHGTGTRRAQDGWASGQPRRLRIAAAAHRRGELTELRHAHAMGVLASRPKKNA